MATVGQRIRERRLELGLSQRALEAPGVSFSFISRVERGKRRPSVRALRQIAPRLGVTVHWLETGAEDPAVDLARFVLEHEPPLPAEALDLARMVLAGSAAPPE
jgi:transcriptional regulator with XRE-family HTH domain